MIPDLALPGQGDWGLLRLPAIPQLLDEMGSYTINDRDIVQDSVQALAMVADLAYQGVVAEPVFGSLYDPG